MPKQFFIGIETAVDCVRVVAVSLLGEVWWSGEEPLASTAPAAACAQAARLARLAYDGMAARGLRLSGVGLGLPGAFDEATGVVRFAPNLGWRNVDFLPLLTRALAAAGLPEVPVHTQNEADAAALSEYEFASGDGEDALAQWLAGSYAAVLADCNMPRMDGYALAAFIREAEQERGLPRIPIVACTANALPSATAKCLAAGMDDYLVKPMQLGQIARCLARWVPGEEAPSLPVLSHGVLDAVCGGDAQARAEILAHFNRLHAEDCATLFEAVRRDDMTSAKAQAHRIRGSCLMIGAVSLADVCERIELLAEGRDAQGVGAAMGALAQENARLQHALATSADTAEATR